jgi:hypothetical protein
LAALRHYHKLVGSPSQSVQSSATPLHKVAEAEVECPEAAVECAGAYSCADAAALLTNCLEQKCLVAYSGLCEQSKPANKKPLATKIQHFQPLALGCMLDLRQTSNQLLPPMLHL